MFSWKDTYRSFVNLDHRTDRLEHMTKELARVGIDAVRTRGMLPKEYVGPFMKVQKMYLRTPGAIGCHFSQVAIMKEALAQGKSAMVFEDDLIFCSDIKERLDEIERFINVVEPNFDVIWLGGTFHVNPPYWHNGTNSMLPNYNIGRDAECTGVPNMMRTYGAFSTHAYIVNVKSIERILELLDVYLDESIGIDYLFIRLQPLLRTFSYVPGCVIQKDNMSDIGTGMTIYSGFSKLNGTIENSAYWFQDRKEYFDPKTFNWAECNVPPSNEVRVLFHTKEVFDFISANASCRTEPDGTKVYNVFGSWQKIAIKP